MTVPPVSLESQPLAYSPLGGGLVRATRWVRLPDTPRRAIAASAPAAPVAQRPASRAPAAPPAPTRAQLEAARVEAQVASAQRILAEGRARHAAEARHVASILALHRGDVPAPAIPAADARRASEILALVPRRRGARHG